MSKYIKMNEVIPPYFAVIFTSKLKENSKEYDQMAEKMYSLAKLQEGFLNFKSVRRQL